MTEPALRKLVTWFAGRDTGSSSKHMAAVAAGAVVAACQKCAHQLPDELRYRLQTGNAATALKADPEPMQEVGRFVLNV